MTQQGRFPIIGNKQITETTWCLSVEAPPIAEKAQAGQFLTLQVGETYDPLLRRPFGIHRVNNVRPGSVDVLFRVVGKGTHEMTRLAAGENVDVLGPLGTGFGNYPDHTLHLIVAGGIGVAPFPMLAARIRNEISGARIVFVFGGKTKDDLAGAGTVERFCDETIEITEDGSRGRQGVVTDPLDGILRSADPESTILYTCGPMPMLDAVAKIAHAKNIRCEVSLESQMACGLGTCMGCVTETIPFEDGRGLPHTCDTDSAEGETDCYERICKEGPVFDSREIAWGQ